MKLNFHNVISIIQHNLWVTLWARWNCYLFLIVGSIKTVWPLKIVSGNGAATSFSMCLLFHFRKWWRLSYHYWWNTWVSGVLCPLLIIAYFLCTLQSLFLSLSFSHTYTHPFCCHLLSWYFGGDFHLIDFMQIILYSWLHFAEWMMYLSLMISLKTSKSFEKHFNKVQDEKQERENQKRMS